MPLEGFASRGFCLERVFVEKIQNLTCRFLVVNQVHYKDPGMVVEGKESYFKQLAETNLASKSFLAGLGRRKFKAQRSLFAGLSGQIQAS